jgi:cytidine deaminase
MSVSYPQSARFTSHMQRALAEARAAGARGETPVGAVLSAPDGQVIAADGNRVRTDRDPTAHAEMLVLRAAAQALGSERLIGCDLTVTLEPCPMCAGALSLARIRRIYYGAADPKTGGIEQGPRVFAHSTCHHVPEIYGGIAEAECAALLRSFFAARRG